MEGLTFQKYMSRFEQEIVVAGVACGKIGKRTWMPIRDGTLTRTPFGRLVGTRFQYEAPLVIEYYGLHKRSTGFMARAQKILPYRNGFETMLVNFSAVHDELIAELAPSLLADFPAFKAALISSRFPD